MRTRPQPSRRGGFTLIELLIVISILAVLAALTLAGISRVRAGQHKATTEATVKKLQVALNQQLMTTVEEANSSKSQYVPLMVQFCDGDPDRAKSLAAYILAKRDFPQTFAEARYAITIPSTGGSIPGHKAFSQVPASGSGLSAANESAVLLYMAVLAKGNKGTGSTDDAFGGATGKVATAGGQEFPVFLDAYGTPIAFVRWYGAVAGSELQSPPYVNPNTPAIRRDPYDLQDKLRPWTNATNRTTIALNSVLRAPAGSPYVDFDGLNKVMTVVSAGPDKKFGPYFGGAAADGDDDVYGFRLAQFGAKAP